MEFIIREAILKDYKEIAHICKFDLGYTECCEEQVRDNLNNLDLQQEIVYVAVHAERVIGFIHVTKFKVLYMDLIVNIQGLAVDSEYRRYGVGTRLLMAAEKWVESIGAKYVRLNSGDIRTDAHEFYRNMGYDNEKQQIRFMKEINMR